MGLLALSGFKKIGCLSLILVTLWLGGVGCSSCCATGLADACCASSHTTQLPSDGTSEATASCEGSPTEKSCCQQPRQSAKKDSTDTIIQSQGSIGCSLLPARLEAFTSSVSGIDDLPLQSEGSTFALSLPVPPQRGFKSDSLLIRNRGRTYIQHCSLLI